MEELAKSFLDVIPRSMRTIRTEMRSAAQPELTVLQLRTLIYVGRHKNSTNSEVAEFLGVMPPAMSRMADCLVKSGYIIRRVPEENRRKVVLSLSAKGKRKYDRYRAIVRRKVSFAFEKLTPAQQKELEKGLMILEEVFPS